MKNKTLKKYVGILLGVIIMVCMFAYMYTQNKKVSKEKELMSIANEIVNTNIVSDVGEEFVDAQIVELENEKEEPVSTDNVIGKVVIPKIGIEAPILEGTDPEILKEAVGHFSESDIWQGNVCLASHNRGSYAHYFERINLLEIGDEIIYQTSIGSRCYKVVETKEIDETDLSILDSTEENQITLVTCIRNKQEKRLCVRGVEI